MISWNRESSCITVRLKCDLRFMVAAIVECKRCLHKGHVCLNRFHGQGHVDVIWNKKYTVQMYGAEVLLV